MNQKEVILKILLELGGSATPQEIVEYYCKQHRMVVDGHFVSIVEDTLRRCEQTERHENSRYTLIVTNKSVIDLQSADWLERLNDDELRRIAQRIDNELDQRIDAERDCLLSDAEDMVSRCMESTEVFDPSSIERFKKIYTMLLDERKRYGLDGN